MKLLKFGDQGGNFQWGSVPLFSAWLSCQSWRIWSSFSWCCRRGLCGK
jgi:hypothetical protein